MTPVNNILEVLPVKSPDKKPQAGRQTEDFLSKLDSAARSADDSRADRAAGFEGRGNKQIQAAEAKPVEEPVDEATDTESGETEETAEVLPDVFAAIPIFSSEQLTQQTSEETGQAVLTVDALQAAPAEVVQAAAPQEAMTELISTMDAAAEVMPEAEEPVAQITIAEPEAGAEQPKAQPKSAADMAAQPKAEQQTEPEAAQPKAAETAQKPVEQQPMAEAKAKTAEGAAESFAKQAMQEASQALKKESTADSQKTAAPQSISSEQEAAISESLTPKEDSDGADAFAKPKETPMHTQPMTAAIAQDGKVDFKASMQELRPEQQFQLRQSVQTQIVDQVRSLVTKERTEFYLQLKPEHLGGLSIMLASGEKGLIAKLVTGSKDVHMMIQNDAAQIQESLRERGINVVQMEVVYDQMASATGKQDTNNTGQGYGSNGSGGSQGRLPEDAIEGVITPYSSELSNYEVLAEQGGSVEFSA